MWQGDALCRSTDERAAGAVQRASSAARQPPVVTVAHLTTHCEQHRPSPLSSPLPTPPSACTGAVARLTLRLLGCACCGWLAFLRSPLKGTEIAAKNVSLFVAAQRKGQEGGRGDAYGRGGTTVEEDESTQLTHSCMH